MLTELRISKFRSIHSLEMSEIAPITLLTGKNGSGKSTVLEAIELLVSPEPLRPALQLRRRGIETYPSQNTASQVAVQAPWESMFRGFDTTETIALDGLYSDRQVKARYDTAIPATETSQLKLLTQNPQYVFSIQQWLSESRLLRIRTQADAGTLTFESLVHPVPDGSWGWTAALTPLGPFAGIWTNDALDQLEREDVADYFGAVLQERRGDFLLYAMRGIAPNLKNIVTVPRNKKARLFADFGTGKLVPVSLLGDGAIRVLKILLATLVGNGGVLLVDEIESGIHYSFHESLWRSVLDAAQLTNRQVICTTHSGETMLAAARVSRDSGKIGCFRVDAIRGNHRAVRYSAAELLDSEEVGVDPR